MRRPLHIQGEVAEAVAFMVVAQVEAALARVAVALGLGILALRQGGVLEVVPVAGVAAAFGLVGGVARRVAFVVRAGEGLAGVAAHDGAADTGGAAALVGAGVAVTRFIAGHGEPPAGAGAQARMVVSVGAGVGVPRSCLGRPLVWL
ncbi:hypothetical protein ACI01nite_11750 [Acetobacter cibinongensis]|uniref:Uncharacterized protein n=1 Tax=Acetobacter cibinongensis TaxID=146475 RepID=A0A0D6N5F4_9PROT|nr:hypothetical protein Abci_017_114 [Acetobacter cibinongensis]GBQ13224.1 hypothetical protein AA0482_0518 [Acetobacter cibinongensis NRIC 0482]GEL58573.1 hypothetical protein ACI01nite_11750 [Acetobacter cibinongensis]